MARRYVGFRLCNTKRDNYRNIKRRRRRKKRKRRRRRRRKITYTGVHRKHI